MRSPAGRSKDSFFNNRPKSYGLLKKSESPFFIDKIYKIKINDLCALEEGKFHQNEYYYDPIRKEELITQLKNGVSLSHFLDNLRKESEKLFLDYEKLQEKILSPHIKNMDPLISKPEIIRFLNISQTLLTEIEFIFYIACNCNNGLNESQEKIAKANSELRKNVNINVKTIIIGILTVIQNNSLFSDSTHQQQDVWRKLFFISESLSRSKTFLSLESEENEKDFWQKTVYYMSLLYKSCYSSGEPIPLNIFQQIMGEYLQSFHDLHSSVNNEEKYMFQKNYELQEMHGDFSLCYLHAKQFELCVHQAERVAEHLQLTLNSLLNYPEIPQDFSFDCEYKIIDSTLLEAGFDQIKELECRVEKAKKAILEFENLLDLFPQVSSPDLISKLETLNSILLNQKQDILEKEKIVSQKKEEFLKGSESKVMIEEAVAKLEKMALASKKQNTFVEKGKKSFSVIFKNIHREKKPTKQEKIVIAAEEFIPPISPISAIAQSMTPPMVEQKNSTDRIPEEEQQKSKEAKRERFLQEMRRNTLKNSVDLPDDAQENAENEEEEEILWDFPVWNKKIKPVLNIQACEAAKLTKEEIKKLASMIAKSYTISRTPHVRLATTNEIRKMNLDPENNNDHFIKLRPLGKFGDLRAYGKISSQPNSDGYYEVAFDIINPNAHKQLDRSVQAQRFTV